MTASMPIAAAFALLGALFAFPLGPGAASGAAAMPVPAVRTGGPRRSTSAGPAPRPGAAVLTGGRVTPRRRSPARTHRPLPQPSSRHPLTILVVGDSLGEDLQFGLADLLGGRPDIRLVEDAVGSTGLADVAYYDWPVRLARQLAAVRPQVVVVMLGGNDAVNFDQGGRYVGFGTALWRLDYGARVAAMMREATGAGAYVLWLGMPVMSPSSVLSNTDMRALDAVYAAQAYAHPGVRYLSTWQMFQGPSGGYATYLNTRAGVTQPVRDPDGVHIAPVAGDELVASAALDALDRGLGLRICPSASDIWHRFEPPGCASRGRSGP